MTLKQIILLIVGLAVLIGFPAVMIGSLVQHLRTKPSERRRSGGSAALGAAFQELDRLVARPSVEHTVEAEKSVLKSEDDRGGQ